MSIFKELLESILKWIKSGCGLRASKIERESGAEPVPLPISKINCSKTDGGQIAEVAPKQTPIYIMFQGEKVVGRHGLGFGCGGSKNNALLVTGKIGDNHITLILANVLIWPSHQVNRVCGNSYDVFSKIAQQSANKPFSLQILKFEERWKIINERKGRRHRFAVLDPLGNDWSEIGPDHPWNPNNKQETL